MEKATTGWSLSELAALLEGTLDGPGDKRITGPASLETGGPENLAFAESDDYLEAVLRTDVGAIVATLDAPKVDRPLIRVMRPKQAFGHFLALCQNSMALGDGIHPTAVISASATIAPSAQIGPYAVVEADARVEAGAKIYAFVYVGSNCHIGAGATLYPHAVLYSDVRVGARSIIHANAVLGSDGFGFTWNGTEHVKVPHLGRTLIGEDVEIGCNSAIDRAMIGDTVLGNGTKVDNQVQIAHNCNIGNHVVVASQTGIGGSCVVGDRCTFGGQVGIGDHVKIVGDVTMTARAAVTSDITAPGPYRGAPANPYVEELRIEAALRRLPQLVKRVKELEKRLEQLTSSHES